MKRRKLSQETVAIALSEIKNLMFWAKYGLEMAVSGSRDRECVETIDRLDTMYKLQVGRPRIGKYKS